MRDIIYLPMKLVPKNCCIGYKDKVVHAVLGLFIYIVVMALTTSMFAIVIVYSAAMIKELLDEYVIDGTTDKMDIVATVAIPTVIEIIILTV